MSMISGKSSLVDLTKKLVADFVEGEEGTLEFGIEFEFEFELDFEFEFIFELSIFRFFQFYFE